MNQASTKSDTLNLMEPLKRLPACFYRSDAGREPAREWLKRQQPVEYSWPIGMPLVRSIGQGHWEVRSNLTGGRIARVLFCTGKNCMVLLHRFIKTTRKTPRNEIELALGRMKGNDE